MNNLNLFEKDKSFKRDLLEEQLNIYYYSTFINVFAIDNEGDMIAFCGNASHLCNMMDKDCCNKAHLYAAKQAELLGESYIFMCPSGLVHYAAPLISNKIFKGALIAGPILMDYPDDVFLDDLMRKNKISPNEKGKISSYLNAIPVVGTMRVRYLSRLLFQLALNIMDKDKYALYQRHEKLMQQSKIGEFIHEIKNDTEVSNSYPYEKEKELLVKVRNGDVIGAKTILNEILGYVFFSSGADMNNLRIRVFELCTLLSRAAVEGGAQLDNIFGLNYKFLTEIIEIEDLEELSFSLVEILDRFTENVFNLGESKNTDIIRKAINYINEHYNKKIDLDHVANHVHLNPSYFSTTFKKDTGIRFSDYLNKVRIEESKSLLNDARYNILDVAISVGFEDQSYYSKVFKKYVGMTPKEYREKYI